MLWTPTPVKAPTTRWQARTARLGLLLFLVGAAALALWFVLHNAVGYFHWDARQYGRYWPVRGWLLLHVVGALVALACGPLQLWTGWRGRTGTAHRIQGRLYLAGVLVGSTGGLWISLSSPTFATLGVALTMLAAAWIVSTGLGYAAIRRGQVVLHRELMLRSYVITFAFVTFRFLADLPILGRLSPPERYSTIGWLCWTLPLIATELIVQGRKISTRPRADVVVAAAAKP